MPKIRTITGKITGAVVSDMRTRKHLEQILKSQPIVSVGESYPNYESLVESSSKEGIPQVILADEKNAVRLAEALSHTANIIAAKPLNYPNLERLNHERVKFDKAINRGNIQGTISIEFQSDYLEREGNAFKHRLNDLRNRKRIFNPLTVGIAGMGMVSHKIAEKIAGEPWLKQLTCFSDHKEALESGILAHYQEISPYTHKIRTTSNLNSFLNFPLDIIIIARGKSYKQHPSFFEGDRSHWQDNLHEFSLQPVNTVLEKIVGLNSLVWQMSNVVERHLATGAYKFGIALNQSTSGSADLYRARVAIVEKLAQRMSSEGVSLAEKDLEYLVPEEVDVPIIGHHGGGEVVLIDRATVRGKKLNDIYPEFVEKESDEIKKRVVELGSYFLKRSKESGVNPTDVGEAVRQGIESLAYFAPRPAVSLYCALNKEDLIDISKSSGKSLPLDLPTFMMCPSKIEYTSNGIKVERDQSFDFASLSQETNSYLAERILAEHEKGKKYLL